MSRRELPTPVLRKHLKHLARHVRGLARPAMFMGGGGGARVCAHMCLRVGMHMYVLPQVGMHMYVLPQLPKKEGITPNFTDNWPTHPLSILHMHVFLCK